MRHEITFETEDHVTIYADKMEPEKNTARKGIVLIIHGILEHAVRYERFSTELASLGYVSYIPDQRGHGRSRTKPGLTTLAANEFMRMVTDLRQLHELAVSNDPDVPVYIFAHSMGTMVARNYLQQYGGEDLAGVILSGPAHLHGILEKGSALSEASVHQHGYDHVDPELLDSVFGVMNASFQPARTGADWITRDTAEVDKYLADPHVQAPVTAGFLYEMLKDYHLIYDPDEVAKICKSLPALIITGDQDPATEFSNGAIMIMNLFKDVGIKDVKLIIYPQARHEMLNELNREEATSDLIGWITKHQ
ncbi:alpha/beta fold hydrolase [Paenibacillus sp. OK003]|uniref:alpha/beta fold hydrolase n=1 Tax=Paenibacillus sp. OK003 TaxID=1884380 RepID=UPI0011142B09|nr:alpha/beta hydrolase [Paenibacillus sp. OK003]